MDINLKKSVNKILFNGNDKKGDMSDTETIIKHLFNANMVNEDNYRAWNKEFNRMRFPNPYFAIPNTREFLFFTKPDLNILNPKTKGLRKVLSDSSFWNEMFHKYRRVISDLQVSARRTESARYSKETIKHDKHVFIPMLTNAVNSVLDLPGITAETTDTSQTIYGTSIQYRKSSLKSDEGFDFSLDFTDAPWLDVYHFFKMWDEYETLKDIGYIGPPTTSSEKEHTGYYRINKILHDQIAIYKFVIDGTDMETILYYAKLTGCFPKSVPRDTLASFKGEGLITFSVDWHAQFVEDSNPNILYDFNELCYSYNGGKTPKDNKRKYVPIYNNTRSEINGGFRIQPYIEEVKDTSWSTGHRYLLRWYD